MHAEGLGGVLQGAGGGGLTDFLHKIGGIFGKIVDYFYFCQKKEKI